MIAFNDWLVEELYPLGWSFYRQTITGIIRVTGNAWIAASLTGVAIQLGSWKEVAFTIFSVPSKSLIISLPAILLVLVATVFFPGKIVASHKQLRPLIVAAVLAGIALAALFVLDPTTQSISSTLEKLNAVEDPTWQQVGRLVGLLAATAIAIVLVPLISFHVENSNCGMSLLPISARKVASIAFAGAAVCAAVIATISNSALINSLPGVGLSVTASVASYFLGSNVDIDL